MPKRIVVAIDGTWVNSDNGYIESISGPGKTDRLAGASNITRLCRALKSRSTNDVQQLVYYQGGLATGGSWWSFLEGFIGAGIDEAIRTAYGFIANNYEDGDEITLIGFSRGAFTARSVGGLLADVGLLTKQGMESFYPIFRDWETQNSKTFSPQFGTPAWPRAEPARQKFVPGTYRQALAAKGLTRPNVPVKAVAVFDTVGSLGVPNLKLGPLQLHSHSTLEYSFVNTSVAPNVEHAYQALALDEMRGAFSPTVWENPKDGQASILKELKQCWFAGVHSSIGGGNVDTSISDITLAWMMTQLSKHLEFNPQYLDTQRKLNVQFYDEKHTPDAGRGWGMGLIKRSDTGFLNTLMGRITRTPGEYHRTDPETGAQEQQVLINTHEFIHESVRYREDHDGREPVAGTQTLGSKPYKPDALADWEYFPKGTVVPNLKVDPKWENAAKWVKKGTAPDRTYIVEETVAEGSFEQVLTDSWAGVDAFLAS